MTGNGRAAAAGAAPRTEYPPFGDNTVRKEWTKRLAEVTSLSAALDLLIAIRDDHQDDSLETADTLWIEARIEDRVAVLRFAELSGESIDTTTLTGEPLGDACASAIADAKSADDTAALENVVATFRRRYKPPVMPTVPFMRTETELAELLMLRRSKRWFDVPLSELRQRRAAVLVDEGAAATDV